MILVKLLIYFASFYFLPIQSGYTLEDVWRHVPLVIIFFEYKLIMIIF